MSDEKAAAETESASQDNPIDEFPAQGDQNDDVDWKAEARKWEQRAKENKSASAELTKLKAANMSELEKAQAAAAENLKAAETARSEALRLRIAIKHGISDEDAETFLTGTDEESLTKQAERLAAMAQVPAGPTTPKPDLTQGGSATPPALNGDGIESALKTKLGIR